MRPRIEGLDVASLEWKPLGPPGLYSKLLSRDPETGARTALQRLCPADDYEAPKVAHYHTTYEEILGVSGLFTFDSRTWIRPGSYVFHPPRTVHGFKSAVLEESWFLSRVGRDLDVNLVHEPIAQDLYVIDGATPARRPVALADPFEATQGEARAFLGAPVEWRTLSAEPATGEGSALVVAPAGWRTTPMTLPHYVEIFALRGCLAVAGAPPPSAHAYFFYAPGEPIGELRAESDVVLYVNFGGASPA
jgi:hypothetical protein